MVPIAMFPRMSIWRIVSVLILLIVTIFVISVFVFRPLFMTRFVVWGRTVWVTPATRSMLSLSWFMEIFAASPIWGVFVFLWFSGGTLAVTLSLLRGRTVTSTWPWAWWAESIQLNTLTTNIAWSPLTNLSILISNNIKESN